MARVHRRGTAGGGRAHGWHRRGVRHLHRGECRDAAASAVCPRRTLRRHLRRVRHRSEALFLALVQRRADLRRGYASLRRVRMVPRLWQESGVCRRAASRAGRVDHDTARAATRRHSAPRPMVHRRDRRGSLAIAVAAPRRRSGHRRQAADARRAQLHRHRGHAGDVPPAGRRHRRYGHAHRCLAGARPGRGCRGCVLRLRAAPARGVDRGGGGRRQAGRRGDGQRRSDWSSGVHRASLRSRGRWPSTRFGRRSSCSSPLQVSSSSSRAPTQRA